MAGGKRWAAPTLSITPRYWTYEACNLQPITDTITLYNPTPLRLDLIGPDGRPAVQLAAPGVDISRLEGAPTTTSADPWAQRLD